MTLYTSKELSGTGSIFIDTLISGAIATLNFNVVGSDAIESLSGSAYFTMERQTNENDEYDVNIQPLTGKFTNSAIGKTMEDEDLGFVENTYRWSINVGNIAAAPRIRFVPDFDVNDSPVVIRATGGINVNVTIITP